MIYNLPSNPSINNNSTQNFGFKVKVLENSKLLDMADSYTFSSLARTELDSFARKADKFFPEKTIVIDSKVMNPKPYETFRAVFWDGDKELGSVEHYSAHGLLTYITKATNAYTHVHSKFFYGGEFSPQTLEKSRKIRKTCGTLVE